MAIYYPALAADGRPRRARNGSKKLGVFRRTADKLLSRLVPEVDASALYYWEYRCAPANCGGIAGKRKEQKRQCHDGSGVCFDWQDTGLCCL